MARSFVVDDSTPIRSVVTNFFRGGFLTPYRVGSNQLGDLAPGAYSDYTRYQSVNSPSNVTDPNRWQPLLVFDSKGEGTTQQFVAPQWGLVKPFGLTSGAQFRPAAVPNLYPGPGYEQQAQEVIDYSANFTDEQKAIVEYWADGPGSELPPGHWALFAQWVSRRDSHTLDDDVKMFFALTNALLDASIAVWDCKRAFDYVRPITAVRFSWPVNRFALGVVRLEARKQFLVSSGKRIRRVRYRLPPFLNSLPGTAASVQPLPKCFARIPAAMHLDIRWASKPARPV